MRVLKTLRSLPSPLLILLGTLAVLPFWSLTFLPRGVDVLASLDTMPTVVAVLAFWVIPVVLIFAMLARSFVVIPLFLLECLLVVAHGAFAGSAPVHVEVIRYVLGFLMAVTGVLFLNKDLYFPFFAPGLRFWRKAPRMQVNAIVRVVEDDAKPRLSLMMEDCSLSGLAVAGDREELDRSKPELVKGEAVRLELSVGAERLPLEAEVAWIHDDRHMRRFGLRVADAGAMSRMIDEVGRGYDEISRVRRYWLKSSTQRAALALWGISLVGSYSTPACQKVEGEASETNSLDNLTRADGETPQVNRCGTMLAEDDVMKLRPELRELMADFDASSDAARRHAMGALTAVPSPMRKAFFAARGRIRLVTDPGEICPEIHQDDFENIIDEGIDQDGCWLVDEGRLTLVLRERKHVVHHGLLRLMAYAYSQFYADGLKGLDLPDGMRLKIQAANRRFEAQKKALAKAFLEDARLPEAHPLRRLARARPHDFLDVVFAETVDSYYCSEDTLATMKKDFPRTYTAFTAGETSLASDLGRRNGGLAH